MTSPRPLLLFVGVSLACAASATAQPANRAGTRLPAVFVGGGIGPATNDASSRMRLYEEGLATVWIVEAGVAASERLGVGVEFSQPSAAKAFTTIGAGRAQIAGRQEERVLLGLVRLRLAGTNRFAVDVVGGGGVLLQHHEMGGCDPAVVRCESTDGPAVDEQAPAFAAGVDVPIQVAPHLAIGGAMRAYFLRRGEHLGQDRVIIPWQQEWRSSTRVAAIVNARLHW